MKGRQENYEDIWGMLLSREVAMIEKAFSSLESDQKKAVLDHLDKMVTEPGWQPEQRVSAQIALDTISYQNT
jgi:hypothetical protein